MSNADLRAIAAGAFVAFACAAASAQPVSPMKAAPAAKSASAPKAEPPANGASSAAAKASQAPVPGKATIGMITELAREIKLAQLRKELRDAGQQGGNAAAATLPGTPPAPAGEGGPLPKSAPRAPVRPEAVPAALPAPAVSAILGVEGKLKIRTSTGGVLGVGQSLASSAGIATIKGVLPTHVVFEVCERPAPSPAKPAGKSVAAAPRCETRNVVPTGI